MTTKQTMRRKWIWLRRTAWVLGFKVVLILIAVVVFFGSGAGNPLLRRLAIKRINSITGGQTEIRSLSVEWLAMQATVKGLVIHGQEPAGTPRFSRPKRSAPVCGSIPSGAERSLLRKSWS